MEIELLQARFLGENSAARGMAASLGKGSCGVNARCLGYQRLCKSLPNHLVLARDHRAERVLCQAIALPHVVQYWVDELTSHIPRRRQKVRLCCVRSSLVAPRTRPIILDKIFEKMWKVAYRHAVSCAYCEIIGMFPEGLCQGQQ